MTSSQDQTNGNSHTRTDWSSSDFDSDRNPADFESDDQFKEGEDEERVVETDADESTNAPMVQRKLKKLRDKLNQCEQQKREYLTGWQRAKADFINTQKKWESNQAVLKTQAQVDVIQDLLPVLDSFEMAWANMEAWEAIDKNWRTGIEQIYAQLWEVLKKYDIKEIQPAIGEVFDPEVHEALSTVETEAKEEGTVQEVIQKGYRLPDRVIRAAKVKVGQGQSV